MESNQLSFSACREVIEITPSPFLNITTHPGAILP